MRRDRAPRCSSARPLRGPRPDGPGAAVQAVAFESENRITNAGTKAWTKDGGLVSIWILGMFKPSPDDDGRRSRSSRDRKRSAGRSSTTPTSARCPPIGSRSSDGRRSSSAATASSAARSASRPRARATCSAATTRGAAAHASCSTTGPPGAPRLRQLHVGAQKEPYGGDVVNSYNDGPPGAGQAAARRPSTSSRPRSPAAALAPGESLDHVHRTFHFVGEPAALDADREEGARGGARRDPGAARALDARPGAPASPCCRRASPWGRPCGRAGSGRGWSSASRA